MGQADHLWVQGGDSPYGAKWTTNEDFPMGPEAESPAGNPAVQEDQEEIHMVQADKAQEILRSTGGLRRKSI
jgi:hypothetical protein